MKKYVLTLFLMLIGGILICAATAQAADSEPQNSVLLTEVFPGNPSPNAGQEFIELYNPTAADIDLTGWRMQYTSAAKTDWNSPSRNIVLTGTLKAAGYYLLTSTGYLANQSNLSFSASLSQTGGHLRLIDKTGTLQDQMGWGNAAMPLGVAIAAPPPGSSISRLTNAAGFNLSQDNNTDFAISLSPTPGADNLITMPPAETDEAGGLAPPPATTPPVRVQYALIQISELLPNPAPPQSDDKDEFVELYNPNAFDVDLTGYVVATGLRAAYRYTIQDMNITAGGYLVFASKDTKLSLSNTAGKAQLFAPDGSLIDETGVYEKAASGVSWIFNNGAWVWTGTPTNGLDNIYTELTFVKAVSTKTPKTSVAKTTKRKSAASPKPKKAKAPKPAVPLASAPAAPAPAQVHPLILASVGSGALLYALYEYRNDLGNTLYRARRYREARGSFWPAFDSARNSRAAVRLGRWQNHLHSWVSARLRQ